MVASSKLKKARAALATAAGILVLAAVPALAAPAKGYKQVNLVSDQAGAAPQDAHLKNPWGVAFIPGNPFWVANNHTSSSTLYDASGVAQALVVSIPGPGGAGTGSPTGLIANTGGDFGGDLFIFATEDGTIVG